VSPWPAPPTVLGETLDIAVRVTDSTPLEVHIGELELEPAPDGTWIARAVPLASEGLNTLLISARDAAGNSSSLRLEVTRDTQGPSLASFEPAPGSSLTAGESHTFAVLFDEPVRRAFIEGEEMMLNGQRATGAVVAPATAGTWRVRVTSEDLAGNQNESVLEFSTAVEAPVPPPATADFMAMPRDELAGYTVELETNRGVITLELWPELAPHHVRNFLDLASTGFYDGTIFHRVIKDFMIQGGDPTGTGAGEGPRSLKPEFSGRKHERGVLSMARGPELDSATSQFFIMHAAAPSLDGEYTVFGRVTSGMKVVDAIAKAATGANNRPEQAQLVQRAVVLGGSGTAVLYRPERRLTDAALGKLATQLTGNGEDEVLRILGEPSLKWDTTKPLGGFRAGQTRSPGNFYRWRFDDPGIVVTFSDRTQKVIRVQRM